MGQIPSPHGAVTGAATAGAAKRDCDAPPSGTWQEAADVLYLPSVSSPSLKSFSAQATTAGPNCSDAVDHIYVAYALKNGHVRQRLVVSGPTAARPLLGPNGGSVHTSPAMTETIGGIPRMILDAGDYNRSGNRRVYASWQGSGGGYWLTTTVYGTLGQMRSVLSSLTLTGDVVDTSVVPAGYTSWVNPLPDDPHDVNHYFTVQFGRSRTDTSWSLQVCDLRTIGVDAPVGGERVQFGTASGWWVPPKLGRNDGTLYWHQDGIYFELASYQPSVMLRSALDVARSLRKVSSTDPRLT